MSDRAGTPTDHEAQVLYDKLEADRKKDTRIEELEREIERLEGELDQKHAKLVEVADKLRKERTRADDLEKKLEAARELHLECWMTIHEGRPDTEAFGIGKVFGLDYGMIEDALYNIKTTMEEFLCEEQIPHGACGANFRASNFVREEGQMTFPETGQWDFPPYWDMSLELIGYDFAGGKDGE